MRLLGKSVRVTVAGLRIADLTVSGRPPNAVEIERLQVRYDVKKDLTGHPNKCVIKITNLAPLTRSQLETKPLRVMLHAGYDGVLKLLFDGDMTRAFSERDGRTDTVTELHVGDGARSYTEAHLNRSYRPPVTLSRIVRDCAESMKMVLAPEFLRDPALNRVLDSGFSSDGLTRHALTSLLEPLGLSWSSQDRQLVVLGDSTIRPGRDVVINQSTGLLGSPKLKEPSKEGQKSKLTFQHLLYPEIVPGCGAKLESEFLNQRIKIESIHHHGDTHADDWNTDGQGAPQ